MARRRKMTKALSDPVELENLQPRHKLTQEQNRISRKLTNLFGELAAQLYLDLCRMGGQHGNAYHTQRHIAAHIMRELEGVVKDYLYELVTFQEPNVETPWLRLKNKLETVINVRQRSDSKEKPNEHRAKISKITKAIDRSGAAQLQKSWIRIITKNEKQDYRALMGEAHVDRKSFARTLNKNFQEALTAYENWLKNVIKSTERAYHSYLTKIDAIKANPTQSNAKALRKLPNAQVLQAHFFDGNEDARWLELLESKKFFSKLPPLQLRQDDVSTIYKGRWPAGSYLARMAERDERTAAKVLQITLQLDWRKRNEIIYDVINIAVKLPVKESIKILPVIMDIFKSEGITVERIFMLDMKELLIKWINSDKQEAALSVLSHILKAYRSEEDGTIMPIYGDEYFHKEIVTVTQSRLSTTKPFDTLIMFTDLLADALNKEFHEDVSSEAAFIFNLRPEIFVETKYRSDDIINTLITAVRESLISAMEKNDASVAERSIQHLQKFPNLTIRRIVTAVMSRYPELSKSYLTETVLSAENYKDMYFQAEYSDAVRAVLPTLTQDEIAILSGHIDGEYDLENRKENYRFLYNGNEPPTEWIQEQIKRWRETKVKGWAHLMPVAWKEAHPELINEYTATPRRRSGYEVTSRWGSVTPIEKAHILEMEDGELIDYFRNWIPTSNDFDAPTYEGLEFTLSEAAKAEPERFSRLATRFIGMKPNYVGRLLNGLRDSAAVEILDWDNLLTLCEWAVNNNDESSTASGEDNEWYWVKGTICDLVKKLLSKTELGTSPAFHGRILNLIQRLLNTEDYQLKKDDSKGEGFGYSMNVLRGRASECMIKLVLETQRHSEIVPNAGRLINEMQNEIETRMTGNDTESRVVRSMVAVYFPWLNKGDTAWGSRNLELIFNSADSKDVAWQSYINHTSPYIETFLVLEAKYLAALNELPAAIGAHQLDHFEEGYFERLTGHVAQLGLMLDMDIRDDNSLIGKFLSLAGDSELAEASHILWLTLGSPELPERARLYIEQWVSLRRSAIQRSTQNCENELQALTFFVPSDLLPLELRLDVLDESVKRSVELRDPRQIFALLVSLPADQWLRALKIANDIIASDGTDYWHVSVAATEIAKLLTQCSTSNDQAILDQCFELRGILSSGGHLNIIKEIGT